MKRGIAYLLLAVVAAAFLGGALARGQLDLDVTPQSIRAFVEGLGWWGPGIYLALVAFRTFLLLPSFAVLTAGGLGFGILTGTLLGGAGLLISAFYQFALSRGIGRELVRPRMRPRLLELERRVERFGPIVVGFSTAHPIGPLTPVHVAAGLSSISALAFAVAVVVAVPLRSLAWALLGEGLHDLGSPLFIGTTLGLLAVTLLPLALPWVSRQLFRSADARGTGA